MDMEAIGLAEPDCGPREIELVNAVLSVDSHWEQDLTQVPGLVEQVANDLDAILEKGMREAVRPLC